MEFIEFRKKAIPTSNRWRLTKHGLYVKNFSQIKGGTFVKFAHLEKSKFEQFPRFFFKICEEHELNAFKAQKTSGTLKIMSKHLYPFIKKLFNVQEEMLYLEPQKTIEGWTELEIFTKP